MVDSRHLDATDIDILEATEGIGTDEINLIRLLHPPTDGVVVFAVSDDDGDFRPRVAVVSSLPAEHVPAHLSRNSYVSLNQSTCWKNSTGATGNPVHRTDTIRYLSAAYVDLDYYAHGHTKSDVVAELHRLQECGSLPAPSLLVHSGQGLWAVWQLRDEKRPDQPVRVTKEGQELQQHAAIQSALHGRLTHLGADKCASSPVRYLRMPGSFNTKSETVVRWEYQVDEDCRVPRYTLPQLMERLGAALPTPKPQATARTIAANDESDGPKRGQAGWRALRDRRKRDFNRLWKMRNGFSRGCRNQAIFYYSLLMAQSGMTVASAIEKAERLNQTGKPPLRKQEVESSVQSAYTRKYKKLSDHTIADWLSITPDEAAQLEAKAVATRYRDAMPPPAPKITRKEKDATRIAARREAIQRIISEADGNSPTTRDMAALLRQQGIVANHVTVSQDYKALSILV